MNINYLFNGIDISKKITEYLGIVETLDAKLDKIQTSDFDVGVRALTQANRSNSESSSLIRQARSSFNKAISLEVNERLVLSYLGLELCHKYLGDEANYLDALHSVMDVKLSKNLQKYFSMTDIATSFTSKGFFLGLLENQSHLLPMKFDKRD